jgi:hypothetical protein
MHTHFFNAAPGQLQLAHQLDADGPGGGGQANFLDQGAADQAEVTVHVAQADAEQTPRESVIDVADPHAMPGIAAFQFVAIHQADMAAEPGQQAGQLADVILAVAVGVEDEVL